MGRKNKVNERLGFCGVNNQGSKFRVVGYKNRDNVWIEFYDHIKAQVTIVRTTWSNIERKKVTDIYFPSIYGVGFLGKTTSMNKDGTRKESYKRWKNMLTRCYDEKYQLTHPTYKSCLVCEEWKCFATFEKDYEELLKENNFPKESRICLDKDIIHKGNKIYSKESCVIVDQRINKLFVKCDKLRGDLPIGIHYNKKCVASPYETRLSIVENRKPKTIYLGSFKSPELAFNAYKIAKENYIKQIADEYVSLGYITSDSRLYKAMYDYEVEITD